MIKRLLTSVFLILGNYLTAQIPENGLIAYYPLNGTYNDASGNGYHLSATGSVPNPLYTVGRTGASDGSALSIPFRKLFHEYSSTEYNSFQNQSFTMGLWTRSDAFGGEITSVMSLGNEIFIRFWLNSGILRLQAGYLNHSGGSYTIIMSGQLNTVGTPWASGSWRFLSVTRDASTNTMTLRINNSVVATSSSASAPVVYSNSLDQLFLGSGGDLSFNGRIQDAFYYNRSLSDSEIASLVCNIPHPEVTVSASSICLGSSVSINTNATDPQNTHWYSSPFGVSSHLFSETEYITPSLTETTTYYIENEAANGCRSYPRVPAVINVNASPVNTTPSQNLSVCEGMGTSLTVSGTNVRWYDAENNGNIVSNGNLYTIPSLEADTVFYAESDESVLCGLSRTAIPIIVTNVDSTVSLNDFTLTSNQIGASYQWVDCNNGNTAISGETSQSFTALSSGNYAVEVTMNGCTKISDCVTVNFVGVETFVKDAWKIYPNPVAEELFVELNESTSIEIVDVFGKTVRNEQIKSGNNTIDVSSLTSGVYFIKSQTTSMNSDQNRMYLKFVKK
jgi:hypothetical protein